MKPTTRDIPKPLVILALLITLLTLFGCSPEVVVRDREVKIPVPVIEDTLTHLGFNNQMITGTINLDSIWATKQGKKGDTVITVKYFPVLKKFYIKVKPDSVIIHDIDTLKIVKKEVVEMKWYSKLGLILIGCGVMALIGVILLIWRKF